MFARAGRSVDHRRCHLDSMSQWNDDAMHADHFRGAEQCAEVLRVLQRIKDEDKRRFAFLVGVFKNFNNVAIRITIDFRHYTLMVLMNFVQPRTRHALDGNLSFLCHA